MAKNGFEIRLEVLKMAKEMAEHQYQEASNLYFNSLNALAENWNKTANEFVEQTKTMQPKMYTPAEVMQKANELYSFVSKKD
jgi:hypothetical protein